MAQAVELRRRHAFVQQGDNPPSQSRPDYTVPSLQMSLAKQAFGPSRLRAACDEHLRRLHHSSTKNAGAALPPRSASTSLLDTRNASASSGFFVQDCPSSELGGNSRPPSSAGWTSRSSSALWGDSFAAKSLEETHAATKAAAATSMNSRWYPHTTVNRGNLRLTGPASMTLGIDPGKASTHQCPFWEAEKHRFAKVKSKPEARMQTPTRSYRWTSQDAWNDASTHSTFKVTHGTPWSPSASFADL